MILSAAALDRELVMMTDWYTDERNVCRSLPANGVQSTPYVPVFTYKATAPHGGPMPSNPAVPTL